jgi:GH24 family phage-related lysozyme (muramidase)
MTATGARCEVLAIHVPVQVEWRAEFVVEDTEEKAPMYPSVHDAFVAFTQRFEGHTTWLYNDRKGMTTIGYGNLVEQNGAPLIPPELQFVHRDGSPATQAEVLAAWRAVHAMQSMNARGGGAFASLTTIRATEASIRLLVEAKLVEAERVLRVHFPGYDGFPSDAQLGLLSLAWALGPAFAPKWPKFTAAVNAGEWETAADECRMSDAEEAANPGVVPRDDANQVLFRNAAAIVADGLPLDTLVYPARLGGRAGTITPVPLPQALDIGLATDDEPPSAA